MIPLLTANSPFLHLAFFQNNASSIVSWLYFTLVMILVALFLLFLRMRKEEEKKNHEQFQRIEDRLKALDDRAGDLVEALSQLAEVSKDNTNRITQAINQIEFSGASVQPTANGQLPMEQEQEMEDEEAPVAAKALAYENFDKAVHLLRHMEDNHPDNLLKARDLFQQSTQGEKAGEAYTLLAETLFWLGDISEDKSQKERYHGEGVEYGKTAVKLCPDAVEAHLWFAANMGSHGMARGIMSSLFYLGDIEKHGSKAMALDENFFHGAPLRLMGRFYHQCPGWPIGKGDMGKAMKLLEKAVKAGPDFLLNHYYLADAYIAKRKKREARTVLDELLAKDQFEVMPHYQKNVQSMARDLLKKT